VIDLLKNAEAVANETDLALSMRQRHVILAQIFRTNVIFDAVSCAAQAFVENYDAIMEGTFDKDLVGISDARVTVAACRAVARKHVYPNPETTRLELMGHRVISDLLDLFWEGVKTLEPGNYAKGFAGKAQALMSENYRFVFEHAYADADGDEGRQRYARLQLITDYVCGMTDSFACSLHKKLFNG
jgi:dGTPase